MVDLDVHSPPHERFDEYGYMSDSDFDTDTEEEIDGSLQENIASSNGNVTGSESQLTEPVPSLLLPPGPLPAPHAPRRMGRAVVVKGYAFQTWYAFLYYLYTKRIVFRSLNSSTPPGTSAIPECSAKSMYKLADAFALEDLKSLAFSSLKSQLSPQNIVREVFSTFTSFYPEIQDIEVEFLLRHIPNLTQDVDEILRSICDGMRPHCVNALKKIVFERRSES
ncbi:hypothetical protein DFH08DRAFT_854215 [Mycena albidolilacea]|uniref:Uncharacterized protein n=1 Tax=Mycena albidolilacea TaxID=1033008 RepID=A0AAD7AB44_9AGAR|nr:hypothetical protein DFH08DRAFT_854215 [Mycena albidolilacea]